MSSRSILLLSGTLLAALGCGGDMEMCTVTTSDGACITLEAEPDLLGWRPALADWVPEDDVPVLSKLNEALHLRAAEGGAIGRPIVFDKTMGAPGYSKMGEEWVGVSKAGATTVPDGTTLLEAKKRGELWVVGSVLLREEAPCESWTRWHNGEATLLEGPLATREPIVVGLESGTIASLSGQDCKITGGAANPETYLLPPGATSWESSKPLAVRRWQPSAAPLSGDRVFLLGGDPDLIEGGACPDPEIWSPAKGGQVLAVPESVAGRLEADVSVLLGRYVVVVGGESCTTREPNLDVWLYDADSNDWHPLGEVHDSSAKLVSTDEAVFVFERETNGGPERVRRITVKSHTN